ncbi:MAG: cytochrome c maturation protein CcmE [Actinomycetia bacterium]|nr:cytochrome c maturation protein CcmE [Actinomycetes bacterium]
MSKKVRLQLGAAMILVALVYLGIQGARNFSQYFVPVNQFRAQEARYAGQVVRVQGRLLASTVRYDARSETMTFVLSKGGNRLPVKYVGPVPSEQYRDADAIVEGRLGPNGVFDAQKLMIQCPNHYQAADGTAQHG